VKTIQIFGTLLVLVLTLGAVGDAAAQSEPVGDVTLNTGENYVTRSDGTEVALAVGTAIFQQDTVYVGPGGEAVLTFIDRTILSLGAESALTIDELV